MTVFSLSAALLVLIALAFVLVPLLRRQSPSAPTTSDTNLALYHARRAELQADLDSGTLDASQAAAARTDIERQALGDMPAHALPPLRAYSGRWSAALVVVALPLLAINLYGYLGSWRLLHPSSPASAPAAESAEAERPPMEALVLRLEQRLREEPDNEQGWTMLGRAYLFMQRYTEAEQAYAQAYALGGEDNVALLVDYAEAMAMNRGERLQGAPARLLKKALALDPGNAKALWLAGLADFQQAAYAEALRHWQALQNIIPATGDEAAVLKSYIAEAQTAALGVSPTPAPETGSAAPAALPGALKVTVNLNASLAHKAAADDTVFIFARAAQGPRMPLAIAKRSVKDLPLTLTLDDSMSMTPAFKLSAYPEVIVGARISKSGNALPQSGDLQGSSAIVSVGKALPVQVVIDQVVP